MCEVQYCWVQFASAKSCLAISSMRVRKAALGCDGAAASLPDDAGAADDAGSAEEREDGEVGTEEGADDDGREEGDEDGREDTRDDDEEEDSELPPSSSILSTRMIIPPASTVGRREPKMRTFSSTYPFRSITALSIRMKWLFASERRCVPS